MRKQGPISVSTQATVAFHDIDMAAVVWHGHYLKYLENARWALMDRLDFGLDAMLTSGYAWPVVEVHVKYLKAARFGDQLNVSASLVEWQNRLAVNYTITHADTRERVARAQTVQVAVDASTGVLQFVVPDIFQQRVASALQSVGAQPTD